MDVEEAVAKVLENREMFDDALAPFREGYEYFDLYARRGAIRMLFECFKSTFDLKVEDGKSHFDVVSAKGGKTKRPEEVKPSYTTVKLIFTDGINCGPYFRSNGELTIPEDYILSNDGDNMAGTMFHEVYHAIDTCYNNQGFIYKYGGAEGLSHDAADFEIQATKFVFRLMGEFGLDERKFINYEGWQKAFKLVDVAKDIEKSGNFGQMSGKAMANRFMKLYVNTEEYRMLYKNSKNMINDFGKFSVRWALGNVALPIDIMSNKSKFLNKYFEFEKVMNSNPGFDSAKILADVREHFAKQGIRIKNYHIKGKGIIRMMEKGRVGSVKSFKRMGRKMGEVRKGLRGIVF